ncbi:Multidrug resistance protein NorM [Defluviimonas aquaemixtae]|uniref:Multidrug-efflux transporter n=1 Tax=Albidovulum aquaemixtae TaxID=1542388 RepID=A0A2R8B395_9RHOB|nr:MATE family efflux transporter [Defluviimonas aquaemixtae]SPH17042.1 Multidrug resistance protein NorM [Defluviimonas aquaemixtae]
MTERLTYRAHVRALLVLGLPLVGSNLAQMILHVTDTVMLGWYGVEALASVVLGASTFFILFILGAGYSIAVAGMVASALGRGDETQVRRDTRMTMWHSILFGVVVLPILWWSGPILVLLGQDPALAALAQDYLRIAGFGMIPALLLNTLKSYLSALERTQIVLWATLSGAVVNVVLNWMLIFGNWGAPELGVRGAAIATLVTQVATMAILMVYAAQKPELARFHLFQRFWRPDWPAFAQVWRLGWPVGLTGLAEGGLFNASALMMGWVGTIQLAAHGIALEVAALAFMVHLGLSSAATVRAGRAEGERDLRKLRDGAVTAIALSMVFGLVVVAVFLTLPGPIVGLFLDETKPGTDAILAFGVVLLAVAALFQMFDAAQVMALGLLRGVQDTQGPLWISAVSYWIIGIPASYVMAFPMGLGGVGLWLGLTIGLAVAAVLLTWRFWARWGRGVPAGWAVKA